MLTLPREQVVSPFAKINVWHEPTHIHVRAYILVERSFEKAMTGIAVDGSGTMKPWFGAQGGPAVNKMAPIVRNMCSYIAQFDFRGVTDALYWATGESGREIEVVGKLTSEESEQAPFTGPKHYGLDTYLLPALQHFLDHQDPEAQQLIFIFITDGRITDMQAVKQKTVALAKAIEAGKHKSTKLLLIGVGAKVDESHLEELDNLDTGTSQDLWDAKLAAKMDQLAEIFTEMVNQNLVIADKGVVRAENGKIVQDYHDTGVPAVLEFDLPLGALSFTLELETMSVTQPLNGQV